MKDHARFVSCRCQGLCKSGYCQLCVNTVPADTGNDPPVIKVNDRTVIALFVVCKVNIGKVNAPLLIPCIRTEILRYKVIKDFERFRSFTIMILCLPGHRPEPQFPVHVVVNCMSTENDPFVGKELLHHPVAGSSSGTVINIFDGIQDESFSGCFGVLAVLSVVVVGIGADIQAP